MGILQRLFGRGALSQRDRDAARQVFDSIASMSEEMPESYELSSEQRAVLTQALLDLDRVAPLLGRDAQTDFLRVVMLGKLGHVNEAVRQALDLHRRAPSWATAVMVANSLRRGGDDPGAIDYFKVAAELDPDDVTALLEIGDTYLGLEKWEDARSAYEAVLAREPEQPWALPSVSYCRFRSSGERRWLDELRKFADQPWDECGAADLLAQVEGGYSPDDVKRRAEQLVSELEA